jgi:hypothetical protein
MNIWIPLLQESSLTPNQLYLIWCIGTNTKPININIHSELRILKTLDFIDADGGLTSTGLDILEQIPKSKLNKKTKVELTDELIMSYLEIFPRGKLPSGKQARADKKNIRSNFDWFFKTYSYDWDTVIKATKLYVDEYETKNFLYMRTSQYFISKMNPDRSRESELANYCAQIISGDYQDDTNHFSEKVV